jgi:hypothetical protein
MKENKKLLVKIGDEIEVELKNIIAEFDEPVLLRVQYADLDLVFDVTVDYGSVTFWKNIRDSGALLKLKLINMENNNNASWKVIVVSP